MKRALRTMTAVSIACLASLNGLAGAQARPITPAERRVMPFTGAVPACDSPDVLQSIVERFRIREKNYWSSGLDVLGFDRVSESGYRSNGYDYAPRRFCQARATFNDDKYRTVVYWVGEKQGFASYGFGVEWCIEGLDPNYAYGPNCRAARP